VIVATTDQLERARKYLGTIPGAAEAATSRAINAAVRAAQVEAFERIVGRYEISEADVKARHTVKLSTSRNLEAVLRAKSPALPLHYFPHTPTRGGTGGRGKPPTTVTVRRGESKALGPAFIAKLGTKARIVVRTGEKTSSGKDRLKVLYSIPVAEMLGVTDVRVHVEARALEMVDEKLTAEIDAELGKVAS